MRTILAVSVLLFAAGPGVLLVAAEAQGGATTMPGRQASREKVTTLPAPDRHGTRPLEGLLQERVSLREFAPGELSDAELGQLLWATCGVTRRTYFTHRTVPSAGALYPLELYLLTARGVAHYDPVSHTLSWYRGDDRRAAVAAAALEQAWIRTAPAVFVIAAEPARTTIKYGERGLRYVDMECGLACQNLLLQATALGLGGVPVGAFEDDAVAEVIGLPDGQIAGLIVPVGRPR